ncbi:SagB/ThcOx family dehydrogenase [Fervidicoccus fontis]|nr:SagB/ThcOx family dehydrogenase [Fervidicoccus fontis]MBE9391589.1 SagB/ThcOx family dehydrogenase [Fervidicoccus fontis]PMB76863.1 MAG: nitroreductase [Fervidicoccus fontis]HEW64152.1 SagB/ThcOx family dehydrogenase [Fervidicoccus fontis]
MKIKLLLPRKITNMSLEEAILNRSSKRSFKKDPLKFEHLSIILWSAQGLVESKKQGLAKRVAPSAGATYPFEVFVAIGENSICEGPQIISGIYKYISEEHSIKLKLEGDKRDDLARAAYSQNSIVQAPISIILVAKYEITTQVYGDRGIRYVHFEAGHIGQNIYLMATALGLGTVAIGAFDDDAVSEVLHLEKEEKPLYIFPIGFPKSISKRSFDLF